jgi:hypothetical protein
MENENKKEILDYYKNKLAEMIGSEDFPRFFTNFDNDKIMKYSALENYDTIEELLPEQFDYRFILIENKLNSGHWTVLCRYKNTIYYFDSYGVKIDGQWKFIPNFVRIALNQDSNDLTKLLNKAKKEGFKVESNKVKYQSDADGVNTCGRYCIMVVKMIEKGYNMEEIERKLDAGCERFKCNYDILVCRYFP